MGKLPKSAKTLLVVDDDAHIRDVVCFALSKAGFRTVEAENGQVAVDYFKTNPTDLIILDVLMPELDGIEVCRQIRRFSSVPILFLSSKDEEVDRIIGLEIGGDDYITKPFSPRELTARVRAVFRRMEQLGGEAQPTKFALGGLEMNLDSQKVSYNSIPLTLTPTEFGLLTTFTRNVDKVLNRELLMQGAYVTHRIVSDRTIDSHIRRLRDKLKSCGPDLIHTVHGVGYRLTLDT